MCKVVYTQNIESAFYNIIYIHAGHETIGDKHHCKQLGFRKVFAIIILYTVWHTCLL